MSQQNQTQKEAEWLRFIREEGLSIVAPATLMAAKMTFNLSKNFGAEVGEAFDVFKADPLARVHTLAERLQNLVDSLSLSESGTSANGVRLNNAAATRTRLLEIQEKQKNKEFLDTILMLQLQIDTWKKELAEVQKDKAEIEARLTKNEEGDVDWNFYAHEHDVDIEPGDTKQDLIRKLKEKMLDKNGKIKPEYAHLDVAKWLEKDSAEEELELKIENAEEKISNRKDASVDTSKVTKNEESVLKTNLANATGLAKVNSEKTAAFAEGVNFDDAALDIENNNSISFAGGDGAGIKASKISNTYNFEAKAKGVEADLPETQNVVVSTLDIKVGLT